MKALKKALAVIMCVVMTLTAAPLNGFVGMELPDGSGFRKLVENISAAFDGFSTKAQAATYSGTCGDNLTWTLDTSTGVLEINGTGDMFDYELNDYGVSSAPWYSDNSYIKTINIANGITSIGDRAFDDCDSFTCITIHDSVTTIGVGAFCACDSLTSVTIGNSVTTIGEDAFSYCHNLTSVTIPDSVTTIGEGAFKDCDSLTSITVDANNKNYSSDSDGVFFNKDKTTLIQYPIGNTRTSYAIPDSVTTIGDYAFYYCYRLTSVTIPDSVTTIGGYAFNGCTGLTNVTIPDSVTSIDSSAFEFCLSLTSITIPDSVTTIGDCAFLDCESLTSVTIPNSVTTIGDRAFDVCKSCTSITVDANNKNYSSDSYGVLFNKDKTTLIQYPAGNTRTSYVISDSVTTIGDCAFAWCFRLKSITIPDSVTSIGYFAFGWCFGLTSVTIPDSVTTIGDWAFDSCKNLKSVTIPDSVTNIGSGAFNGCEHLTNITIPGSVTTIGDYAFGWCDSLTSITVDANNKNYSSDSTGVFFNKDKTTLIQYPASNTRTSYTVPDSVTTIGNEAFENCDSLKSIIIPDSVTAIGYRAFYACSSLKSITIPDRVTIIGEGAFYSCDNLTNIIIPDSVTIIGDHAFGWCLSLTRVIIPDNVTNIGEGAFYGCDSLKDVYYIGTQEKWKIISIGSYNSPLINATIHYHTHRYTANITTLPTCDEIGVMTFTCHCGDSYTEVIKANGHTKGEWEYIGGKEYAKSCTVCGDKLESKIVTVDMLFNGENVNKKQVLNKSTATVTATVTDNFVNDLVFASSDNSTVSVDANGNVVANNIGKATITVTIKDTAISDSIEVEVLPRDFTVTWNVNGKQTKQTVKEEAEFTPDVNTTLKGYKFLGWDKAVPTTMPAENLTFTAQYELLVKELKIKTPSVKEVKYGDTLILHADIGDVELPEGWSIKWTAEGTGAKIKATEDGMKCEVTCIDKGEVNVTATIVDENGEPVLNAESDELTAQQKLTMKGGFFQKIISFFKDLFRISRIILQAE